VPAWDGAVGSSFTSSDRMDKARNLLDAARGEQASMLLELNEIRRSHPGIHH